MTLRLSLALFLALAVPASASDYEVLWTNGDPVEAAKWVRVCDRETCSRAVAVDCAPGATCRTRFSEMPERRDLWVVSSVDGALWSSESNPVSTDACLLSSVCKFDHDRNGKVTVISDLQEFLRVLGKAWR